MINREIKFRVLSKNHKNWIVFNLSLILQQKYPQGFPPFSENIDLDTLGEYTGLKDKNKKEIYEGDIIKWEQLKGDHIQEVKWDYPDLHAMELGTEEYSNIVVIGNIYENKELLK